MVERCKASSLSEVGSHQDDLDAPTAEGGAHLDRCRTRSPQSTSDARRDVQDPQLAAETIRCTDTYWFVGAQLSVAR